MSERAYTVHVDGNRQYDTPALPAELQPAEYATVGAWADAIATANSVGGSDGETCAFSFKANGDVLERGVAVSRIKDGAFLELIDVSDPDVDVEVELVETEGQVVVPPADEDDDLPDGLHLDGDDVVDEDDNVFTEDDGVWTSDATDDVYYSVPDATIDGVLAWVAGDADKASAALEVELAKGDDARSTLIERLTGIAQPA